MRFDSLQNKKQHPVGCPLDAVDTLIASPRHTDADLNHWKYWLAYDYLHINSPQYATHIRLTRQTIDAFVGRKRDYYVSVSWGKDSVVLAHMMWLAGSRCKYVYVRNLAREPEGNIAVRDAFLSRYPDLDYEEISYDYADADETYYDSKGNPHKWQSILLSLREQYGCHVTGIRHDESAKRRRRFAYFGQETEYSYAPFRYLTVRDVFAYLLENKLPIHPNYAMTGGGRWDKYRIRVAAIGNTEGDGMGRLQWEQEYYSDILAKVRGPISTI